MREKTEQLRAKSEGELHDQLLRTEEELSKLRFDAASHKLKNTKALREGRKLKARILTLLREKRVL